MKTLKEQKTKSGFIAIIFVAIAAVSIIYFHSKEESIVTVSDNAQAGDLALEPCTIEIESGDYDADCGSVVVRENRAKSDSRLIALPITRIRAISEKHAEPIFFLGGGPGSSNMQVEPFAAILVNHDFVMVGYRGVDGSVILDCPEVAQAIKGDGVDILNARSRAGLSAAMRQCAGRLQVEGVDLDGYTIQEVIGDMEVAREGLGYERINLLSASYGTRVAQLYANQHPTRIARSAMIGVNPPGRFVWEPAMIDAQIEHYARLYAKTANPRTADLANTMRNISHNMPERWLFFKIDPGKVKGTTFALLYHRDTAAMAFSAWLAAEEGDPSGLALMSLAYDFVLPNMSVYGEFFSKGVSSDYDPSRDYFTEMDPQDSIIGAPLSKLIWGSATDEDGVTWPTPLMPEEYHQIHPTDVETLLIGGNIDFSTPVEFATDDLMPALNQGTQVILSEMGHVNDVMSLQPEAIERLLTSFYDSGEADDSLFVYEPMDFNVGGGFPLLAKLGMGVVLVLIAVVVGLVWFVVHRLARFIR
ncbi:MAG: alpha/beta fold hydrolase [bacterium]|nr:alpha/beta fold hydrolase [Gammaproteobacteria bacterium]